VAPDRFRDWDRDELISELHRMTNDLATKRDELRAHEEAAMYGKSNGVTWKWVAATLAGILILGGGGWMTAMERRTQAIEQEQKSETAQRAKQGEDLSVIREKIRRVEEDVKEIRDTSKDTNKRIEDTNKKIDELLRRR
jgi:uncharacterized protein HemX